MFGTLFLKECKQISKSITYYIFLACMILFFVTQLDDFSVVKAPVEGEENYGYTYSEDETVIMESAIENLAQEYYRNSYKAYPFGFYKEVILNESKQEKVLEILMSVTGSSKYEIEEAVKDYWDIISQPLLDESGFMYYESVEFMLKPHERLSYDQFLKEMDKVDDLIGGGSSYSRGSIKRNAYVPMTYEQALKEYENIINKDQVSRAFARLFCDYMGIVLGILPVFLAVTRGLRDKRSNAAEVIFSKQASSVSIILSRYLATIIMILVPLLLLSISPTLQSLYSANAAGIHGDALAFVRVILWWLLPTILVSVSVGFFFTELTDSPLGILVQGVWWLVSIFLSFSNLIGNVGWNLIPRFNSTGYYNVYVEVLDQLIRNRIFYAAFSILLLVATIVVYQQKRKGVLNLRGKIFTNRKSKLEV